MAPREIAVLWQDEHLLVVAKPAPLLVVDAPGREGPTLVDLVSAQLGAPVHAVHRLDEETTGALVLARTEEARSAFEALLRRRAVERVYLACVSRVPSPPAGRIESRLVEGEDGIVRSVQGGRGDIAVTNYRTLERRDYGALVECRLETGRRNQIRVHLAELGCPILGDRKYGARPRATGPRVVRPMLHAASIAFTHPLTGSPVRVEVEAAEPDLRPLRQR